MDYKYEIFLNRLYQSLHMSDIVMHTAISSDDKNEKIRKYMVRLENIHKLALSGRYVSDVEKLKRLYYDKYVIKKEKIPDSYYEHQKQILLELGYGYVEITDVWREELAESLICDQKKSLDEWLDYFLSEDAKFYPFQLKYWAFQGMLNLGSFDKEKKKFKRRTSGTVAKFADLNREALALTINDMEHFLEGQLLEDELLNKLLKNGSFGKIYAYNLIRLDKAKKSAINSNDGIWIKYDQGSDYKPLVASLTGKRTGWCTASESFAKNQLKNGDFYVYYTKGDTLEYTEPRIAIRMDGKDRIGEIRGIAANQNIESEMEVVVEEKLKEFADRDNYYKKVNDMKKLTLIYNKNQKNSLLEVEELRFLYEIDDNIVGFGYEKDPRIEEIINSRNVRKDLSLIFNCHEEQVGLCSGDLSKKLVCYYGDLFLKDYLKLNNFTFPRFVVGHVVLKNLIYASNVCFPELVIGNFAIGSLIEGTNVVLPKKIIGNLYLNNLVDGTTVTFPEEVDGFVELGSLVKAEGVILPRKIGDFLSLYRLSSLKGVTMSSEIGGRIYLLNLTDIEGLRFKDEKVKLVVSDKMKKVIKENRKIIFEKLDDDDSKKVIGMRFLSKFEKMKDSMFKSFDNVKKKVRTIM